MPGRAMFANWRIRSNALLCCPPTPTLGSTSPRHSWAGEPQFRSWSRSRQPPLFTIMEDCERRIIIDMLEKCGWNQTEAAERFHVPLSTLNQKIKRLAIEIKKKSRE